MEANMVLLWHHYEEPFSEDELISFAPAFYGSLSAPSPADDLVAWGGQLPVVSLHVISIPVSFHPLGASIILRGAWDWLWGGCCRRKNHCSLFSLVCKQIFDETHQTQLWSCNTSRFWPEGSCFEAVYGLFLEMTAIVTFMVDFISIECFKFKIRMNNYWKTVLTVSAICLPKCEGLRYSIQPFLLWTHFHYSISRVENTKKYKQPQILEGNQNVAPWLMTH